jgi:hypothetical protein
MDGLKPHLMSSKIPNGDRLKYIGKRPQAAALLHVEYGRSLRRKLKACHTLYALNELFLISAHSESQFLNLVESKLNQHQEKDETDGSPDFHGLSNLKYQKRILRQRMRQMQQKICSLRDTDLGKWPKAGGELGAKASEVKKALCRDFDHNLNHTKPFLTQCNKAINILMSSTSIAESGKAMSLQEKISKLTFFAFIFVPFSFSSAFFSMDFRELGDGATRSIWAWFVLSIPLVSITFLAFSVDLLKVLKAVYGEMLKPLCYVCQILITELLLDPTKTRYIFTNTTKMDI